MVVINPKIRVLYRALAMLLCTVLLVGTVALVAPYLKPDAVTFGAQLKKNASSLVIDSFEDETTSPHGGTRTINLYLGAPTSEGSHDYERPEDGILNGVDYGTMQGDYILKLGVGERNFKPTWAHFVEIEYEKTMDLSTYTHFSFYIRLESITNGTLSVGFNSTHEEVSTRFAVVGVDKLETGKWCRVVLEKEQFSIATSGSIDWKAIKGIFVRVQAGGTHGVSYLLLDYITAYVDYSLPTIENFESVDISDSHVYEDRIIGNMRGWTPKVENEENAGDSFKRVEGNAGLRLTNNDVVSDTVHPYDGAPYYSSQIYVNFRKAMDLSEATSFAIDIYTYARPDAFNTQNAFLYVNFVRGCTRDDGCNYILSLDKLRVGNWSTITFSKPSGDHGKWNETIYQSVNGGDAVGVSGWQDVQGVTFRLCWYESVHSNISSAPSRKLDIVLDDLRCNDGTSAQEIWNYTDASSLNGSTLDNTYGISSFNGATSVTSNGVRLTNSSVNTGNQNSHRITITLPTTKKVTDYYTIEVTLTCTKALPAGTIWLNLATDRTREHDLVCEMTLPAQSAGTTKTLLFDYTKIGRSGVTHSWTTYDSINAIRFAWWGNTASSSTAIDFSINNIRMRTYFAEDDMPYIDDFDNGTNQGGYNGQRLANKTANAGKAENESRSLSYKTDALGTTITDAAGVKLTPSSNTARLYNTYEVDKNFSSYLDIEIFVYLSSTSRSGTFKVTFSGANTGGAGGYSASKALSSFTQVSGNLFKVSFNRYTDFTKSNTSNDAWSSINSISIEITGTSLSYITLMGMYAGDYKRRSEITAIQNSIASLATNYGNDGVNVGTANYKAARSAYNAIQSAITAYNKKWRPASYSDSPSCNYLSTSDYKDFAAFAYTGNEEAYLNAIRKEIVICEAFAADTYSFAYAVTDEVYNTASITTATANITNDSQVSFYVKLNPNFSEAVSTRLQTVLRYCSTDGGTEHSLPKGTKMIMYDISSGKYYYNTLSSAAAYVSLDDFKLMGGTETFTEQYAGTSGNVAVPKGTHNRSFIVTLDFSETTGTIADGTHALWLQVYNRGERGVSSNASYLNNNLCTFSTAAGRTFSLSAATPDKSSIDNTGSVKVSGSYTVGVPTNNYIDTFNKDRYLGMKVSLRKTDNTEIPLPKGATITGTGYDSSKGTSINYFALLNGESYIACPTKATTTNYNFTLDLSIATEKLPTGSYKFHIELYSTSNMNAVTGYIDGRSGKCCEIDSGMFTIVGDATFGIKADVKTINGVSDTHLIKRADGNVNMVLDLDYINGKNAASASTTTVAITIQKKGTSGYSNLTTTTFLGGTTSWNVTAASGQLDPTLTLKSGEFDANSTYRLVVTLTNGSTVCTKYITLVTTK